MSNNMKTVLLVPGFQENFKSRKYNRLLKAIEGKNYNTKFVSIQWKYTDINDWVKALNNEYLKHDPKQTILAGFSFGAMTAFLCAAKCNPYELWLFSLSPYFAEDITKLKSSWLNGIGKRRIESFKQNRFSLKARLINSKTLIFVGDRETELWPILLNRARVAHKLITSSKLITVPNCGHDVTDPNYIRLISEAISK
jgi:pimeloyl-ACP methyl ester carboxylesterase